jgi:hypothetical protein
MIDLRKLLLAMLIAEDDDGSCWPGRRRFNDQRAPKELAESD